MWLTFAVLMGTLVNPAVPASLLATLEASSSVLPQASLSPALPSSSCQMEVL